MQCNSNIVLIFASFFCCFLLLPHGEIKMYIIQNKTKDERKEETKRNELSKFSNSFARKPETPTHQLPSPKQILIAQLLLGDRTTRKHAKDC